MKRSSKPLRPGARSGRLSCRCRTRLLERNAQRNRLTRGPTETQSSRAGRRSRPCSWAGRLYFRPNATTCSFSPASAWARLSRKRPRSLTRCFMPPRSPAPKRWTTTRLRGARSFLPCGGSGPCQWRWRAQSSVPQFPKAWYATRTSSNQTSTWKPTSPRRCTSRSTCRCTNRRTSELFHFFSRCTLLASAARPCSGLFGTARRLRGPPRRRDGRTCHRRLVTLSGLHPAALFF
mmetsp:Transcript_20304/g.68840  ORF Transcript_20304/g.68840 Transcript_20304/m.68840 type:complete len:234 (-) Transcript_20304:38-739(-)